MKKVLQLFSKQTLLFCLFLISSVSWGQSESLDCPLGTISGTTMNFATANFSIVHSKGTDSNFAVYSPWRVYTGNNVTFTGGSGVQNITSIVITTSSTSYASAVNGTLTVESGTGTIAYAASGSVVTLTISGTDVKAIRVKPSAQTRWSNIQINYNVANAAPTASSVSVSGTSNVGQQLTGTYTYADTESDPQGTSTFKWYRANDAAGAGEVAIGGATSSTYTLVAGDLGKYIRFGVVPVATTGTLTGTETFSSRVGPVGAGSTPIVTIAGTLNEATLNTATVSVTLANETFADGTLSPANFALGNAPTGVTISGVVYGTATTATITLAYDNTDFDTTVTNFNVTIAGPELTLGTPLTSNNISITAVTETLTLGTITTFGNQCINVLSAEQQFTISGSNLKAGSISLAALSGFTYSETAGGTYTATLSFANSAGTLTNKIIYVKFLPTIVQSYNGNIAVSSNGAPTANRAVVGSGVNTAPTVTSPTSAALTATTATLGGTITVAGCSAITERGIFYSITSGFANGAGTKVSETGSFSTGAFTVGATALTSNTVYYYKAFATSASSGTVYSTQGTFTTTCGVATVPFLQNFESVTTPALPTCSTLQNAGTGNNWVTANVNADGFSSKVLRYTYSISSAANAWYYTQGISLTAGTTYQISYKYGNNSTTFVEKLKVAYGTATVNTAMTNALADYPNITGSSAVTATNYFVAPSTGVFYFGFNAYSDVNEFYLYVDDIAIDVAPTCIVPTALTTSAIAVTSVTLSWTASVSSPTNGYDYYYATSATAPNGSTTPSGSVASGVTTANISGLSSSTTYYFWVRSNCGSGDLSTWASGGSFATSALAAPIANTATDVTSTSFTANWNAVAGATSYVLDVYEANVGANATDLFISEYVEGNGTERYIEIFNGTGATVDLSNYELRSFNNGSTTANNTDVLTGTLANNATLVYRNSSATLYGGTAIVATATGYNGNDAVALYKTTTSSYVDIFGRIGNDPGTAWTGAGGYSTADKTLKRKSAVLGGVTVSPTGTGSGAFTTLTTEWDLFDIDTVSGLGSHTFDGGTTLTYFSQNQNVGNTTSHTVTGLNPETQYYYVVRATDGTASANSNAIEVNTLAAPITWNGTAWSNTVGPDATADAFIDGNYSSTADIICKDLTVNAGKILTIKATNTLTVNGNMTNNGSIVFESTAAGTGNFAAYTGAAIAGTGTVTAERYVPAKRAYRILTTPLKGSSNNTISANWQGTPGEGLLLFSPANYQSQTMVGYTTGGVAPNIRKYNGGWSNITDLTTEPMYGAAATDTKPFLVFVTGADGSDNIASGSAATTLRPTGQLITGTVNHNGLAANTFYALANPYASAISPASLIANNPGQKLWLIDPALGTFGAYATFDGADWTPSTPSGNAANIQSGQGFFIRSASATSFAIAESDKVAGSSTLWFGRNAAESATVVQKDKIRVLLYKQVANDFQLADGILSVNYADGINDVDAMDTNKISNFNESIMFRNNTTNLAIEHRALPQVGDVQQMRMTSTTANPYQLRVFTEGYTNSTLQPYVEDTATGALTAIPTDGSEVTIPFTGVVSNATTPDLRFRIVYQTNLSTTAPSLTNVKVYPNPVVNGQLHINLGADTTNAKYSITNLLGQSVQQGELATTQNTISVPTLTKGVYILNISQEERTYTTKIYVQ